MYSIWTEMYGTGIFFSFKDNLTSTWCFTTAIILDYKQLKIGSFYYINYMTCADCWTLVPNNLTYLLNINFKYVYVVLYYLLN
jgi:hypothetical protein